MNAKWKQFRKALSLLFCSSVVGFSQESVSVSDFRYPETRALDWKGGLSGSLMTGAHEFSELQNASTVNSTAGEFSLQTSTLFFHSTEDHDNLMRFSGFFAFQQSSSSTDRQDRDGWLESKSLYKRGSVSAGWEYRHYLFEDNETHFVGSASVNYFGFISRNNYLQRDNSVLGSREIVQKSYGLDGFGLLGIGYGRMRDGTFVIRALRILERLQEDGVITESLSRKDVLALVDRVAHTREYTTNFERHEKYLVMDIVQELAADGVVLPEAMVPFSIMKIAEVLQEQIEPRFFGWRAYYAVGPRHRQDYDDRSESSTQSFSSSHDIVKDGVVVHRFGAEYGHAFSQWTHLNSDVTLDLPARVTSKFFTLRFTAKAIHQVGERVDVVGTYQFVRRAGNSVNSADDRYYIRSISHNLSATFRYFLEDNVSFNTSLWFIQQSENVYDAVPFPNNDNRLQNTSTFNLSFGISYNII
jgi:hypothetical protein